MLTVPHVRVALQKLKQELAGPHPPALICLNDNINFNDLRVTNFINEWQQDQWSEPAEWELDKE
jgi:hypothetical protein